MGCENGNALCWHRSQTTGRARPSQAVGRRPDRCLLCGLVAETRIASASRSAGPPDQCLLCGLVAETARRRTRLAARPSDQCLLCGLVAETRYQPTKSVAAACYVPPSFRLSRLEYPIVRQGVFENISL